MRCPQCECENPAAAAFCVACGSALERRCPTCGTGNSLTNRFCHQCGRGLAAAETGDGRKSGAHASTGDAERRQLTVMFCDLVGSTELSQRLDPEDLREVLRVYQDTCAEVIGRFDGHVAQTLGDGLMVYFGYPRAHEDDAQRAVRAGLEIVKTISALGHRLDSTLDIPVAVRIGVHTGLVVAGEVSAADTRGDMAVVGETPNIAARLQALAEPNALVIGERTRRLAGEAFAYEEMGAHRLKGVTEPMPVLRVLDERATESRFEATHRATLTPLVGREEEVGLLLGRWEQAKDGDGQVVLLSGEPGIGKSRLVAALRERIGADAHTRLLYQCSPFFTNSTFYPIIQQLERAAQFEREDSAQRRLGKLERLLADFAETDADVAPLLAALLSLPTEGRYPPLVMSPQRQRERTVQALVDHVQRLAVARPVLIVFEDVHWIDPSTLEMLDLLIDRIAPSRVLLLITFRPEFVPSWGAHAHLTAHGLNRLSKRQAAAMVHRVTGGKPLPESIQAQIVGKADGVPLFIEELTKAVLEEDWLVDAGERYELAAAKRSTLNIPATLHDSLMARLDRLIPVKEVAQIGAAIGRDFSYEMIAALSPMKDQELRGALDRLVESELVLRRGRPPQATFMFKHALIQEAAYQSLLHTTRQRVHQRIAEVIIERFPAQAEVQPEVVAHHYTEAGLGQAAVEYWERAGRRAVARSSYSEALAHFNKALEVLQTQPASAETTRREVGLQVARGFAVPPVKGWGAPEGRQSFSRALELTRDDPDSPVRFGALWGLWSVYAVMPQQQKSRHYAEECVALAQRVGNAGLLVEAYLLLGISLFFLGDLAGARVQLESCIATYDPEKHRGNASAFGQDPVSAVGLYLPAALSMLGYTQLGTSRGRELVDFTRTLDHPHSLAFALTGLAWSHLCCREWPAAQRVGEELIAMSSEQGFPFWHSLGRCMVGRAQVQQGAGAGAVLLQTALAQLKAMGMMNFYTVCLPWAAEADGATGRARQGLDQLAEVPDLLQQTDQRYAEAELYCIQGALFEQLTPPDDRAAEAAYLRAIEIARQQQTKLLELRAATSLSRLWQRQDKGTRIRELLGPIRNWFGAGTDSADLAAATSILDTLR